MTEQVVEFSFAEGDALRLDHFLVRCLPEFSRSRLQSLIKDGFVRVDGAPVRKAGAKLEGEAMVAVHIPPAKPSVLLPEEISIEVIYEDSDLLVLNKAAGMVVHPSAGHESGTLVHAALAHAPDIEGVGGEQRPGVVHRLDKDTSGLIVLAKNDRAHRFLQDQFRERAAEKVYLALVDGAPPTAAGRVAANIGRDTTQRKRMRVVPDGKGREAVTEYNTLERFDQHSLLEAHPITGRTHQIRVHMAYLGCPVVGDRVYGRRKTSLRIKRHFLHAAKLGIRLPGSGEVNTFEAELPGELVQVLDALRRKG